MKNQELLLKEIPCDKFDLISKEDLIVLFKGEQKLRLQFQKENEELKKINDKATQKSMFIGEELVTIKNNLFGKSSEKSKDKKKKNKETKKEKKKRVQLPSSRYPNIEIIEQEITLDEMPKCKCCNSKMQDSGLTEDSECLTSIPRKFFILKQKRHKYRCDICHGALHTAPLIPKIKEGSSYSDEMVIDVAMSKYCDLIPIERYTKMAGRSDLEELPANSLIQATHNLADFVRDAYDKSKDEIINSKVVKGDETPHRMLEGSKIPKWYLWGFSTATSCYFEAHGTRSGDVIIDFLKDSSCEYLVSDAFSGYGRATRVINNFRTQENLPFIINIYCNAHARRKFKDAEESYEKESEYFIKCYQKIYKLEKTLKDPKAALSFERVRFWQKAYFRLMERQAIKFKNSYSSKSSIGKAYRYFYRNYGELTAFLRHKDVPIDNNPQERLMRSPVVGRKTWYGTHSKRGAQTAAILFTLVESCKLNKINPYQYFTDLVKALHLGEKSFTPHEYANIA